MLEDLKQMSLGQKLLVVVLIIACLGGYGLVFFRVKELANRERIKTATNSDLNEVKRKQLPEIPKRTIYQAIVSQENYQKAFTVKQVQVEIPEKHIGTFVTLSEQEAAYPWKKGDRLCVRGTWNLRVRAGSIVI